MSWRPLILWAVFLVGMLLLPDILDSLGFKKGVQIIAGPTYLLKAGPYSFPSRKSKSIGFFGEFIEAKC